MTIFVYDSSCNKVQLNEPEIILIKEFSELWNNDKSKNKDLAFRQFTFIYLMIDWQSPYSQYTEKEKYNDARIDANLTDAEYNDESFRAACRKYKSIQESSRDIKLVKAAQNKVDELIDYFNSGSDLQERDPITGKPIFKAKDIMSEITKVSEIVDELDSLETRLKKKQRAESGLRAGAVEGYTPDHNY